MINLNSKQMNNLNLTIHRFEFLTKCFIGCLESGTSYLDQFNNSNSTTQTTTLRDKKSPNFGKFLGAGKSN